MSSTARKASALLTRDEIRQLTGTSDLLGCLAVVRTWAIVAAALALAAYRPGPVTYLVAIVVLGGRQLALAVLMHDASHRSLFRSRWLNDFAGRWLCGAPIWTDLDRYRTHHMAHHTHTGTERDTDLSLVTALPTTRAGLARKFTRDLLGLTALKRVFGLLLMDLGIITYTASGSARRVDRSELTARRIGVSALRNLGPPLITNVALAALLEAAGHGWLYLLWVAAYFTTFSLFMRIRSMAEHACTALSDDPLANTRTTQANLLARLTVAPLCVNYHLEHHLLMTVPYYRLRRMHELLRDRGVYDTAPHASGYWDVLSTVSSSSVAR